MQWRQRMACAALCAAFAVPVTAGDAAPKVTGIYSDLAYNAEAGDLLGMELVVVPGTSNYGPGYMVFVQIAEGGAPYTAVVPLVVRGRQVEFTLPIGNDSYFSGMHFVGRLTTSALIVRADNGDSHGVEQTLRRGRSYWQRTKEP